MKGNTELYATVYGEGSGNLRNIYDGKDVPGIIITGVDAIDPPTNERYTFDEKKQTIDEFKKEHPNAKIMYTLSRKNDVTGKPEVIGRVDEETLLKNTINQRKTGGKNSRAR